MSSNRRCWATIDLAALERNIGKIRAELPKLVKYISVVKADAYGHGLPQVVPRLMGSFIDCFAVATVYEAVTIRELGKGWPILVLGALLPEEDDFLIEYNLTGTVSSLGELKRFEELGQTMRKKVPVHLKVDTGMGRAGVWYADAEDLFRKILDQSNIELTGIYTHFASADGDLEYTSKQRKIFAELLIRLRHIAGNDFKDLLIHADNSAGLETLDRESSFNAVRLGIIQFGVLQNKDSWVRSLGIEAVLTLKARVGLIKTLPKGASISYGRTYMLQQNSRIAIITAGYGDGVPIGLSNKGEVIVAGNRCPIIGRITMDQTIVDITNFPSISVGDEVVLIGEDEGELITISDWSRWANTIEYDIYCSITKRVPRNYLNNSFS